MSRSPPFTEQSILPTRVAWPKSRGTVSAFTPSIPTRLHLDSITPGATGRTVLLDFGKELFGGVRFEVGAVASGHRARLRVRLGESISEALVGGFAERTLDVRSGQSVDGGVTGFRFACIDLAEEATSAELTGLRAYCVTRDLEYRGAFRCDDERLNRIWDVGVYTVHLCMQELLWDGVKRGRSVWAGDLYPAAAVVAAVFGDHSVVRDSLDHVRDRSLARNPAEPDWMNGIPAYSLWWVITQDEWYRHHGGTTYLAGQREYLHRLLPLVFDHIDARGRERLVGWRFLDWASVGDAATVHCGYQGLTAWALRSAARLCAAAGEDELRDRCTATLGSLARYRPSTTRSEQARALMALGGVARSDEPDREGPTRHPAVGLTPFLGYAVLEARAAAGDYAGCLDLIRAYWGAMIDLGATTFWEDFDLGWVSGSTGIDVVPDGRRDVHADFGRCTNSGLSQSLCHGWSAGPTAWLSRHVLGVRPVEPGHRVVRVRPHLGGLRWAEGAVPTPSGVIRVRHERRADGSIASAVDAPHKVQVIRS